MERQGAMGLEISAAGRTTGVKERQGLHPLDRLQAAPRTATSRSRGSSASLHARRRSRWPPDQLRPDGLGHDAPEIKAHTCSPFREPNRARNSARLRSKAKAHRPASCRAPPLSAASRPRHRKDNFAGHDASAAPTRSPDVRPHRACRHPIMRLVPSESAVGVPQLPQIAGRTKPPGRAVSSAKMPSHHPGATIRPHSASLSKNFASSSVYIFLAREDFAMSGRTNGKVGYPGHPPSCDPARRRRMETFFEPVLISCWPSGAARRGRRSGPGA